MLSDHWSSQVTVTDATVVTAGARRLNAVFTAHLDGDPRRLVLTLLPQGAEAHNSLSAEAEMVATAERWGVKVPHVEFSCDDVSVLGVDDTPTFVAIYPDLTTMHYPATGIARAAGAILSGKAPGDVGRLTVVERRTVAAI